jgi:hypothetical protein
VHVVTISTVAWGSSVLEKRRSAVRMSSVSSPIDAPAYSEYEVSWYS